MMEKGEIEINDVSFCWKKRHTISKYMVFFHIKKKKSYLRICFQ